MKAHGGYFLRLETFSGLDLVALARQALRLDGQPTDVTGLRVSVNARRKLVRLAYDGASVDGEEAARWYVENHSLARLLSSRTRAVVHAYSYDPAVLEEVAAYGNGRRVGGERLEYSDVDLPENADELDDAAFERLRSRWPLGHLAYVIGISRNELLMMPHAPGRSLRFDDESAMEGLDSLLPHAHVRAAG